MPDIDVRSAIDRVLPETRADLEALVRIPSISPANARPDDVRRAVEEVARLAGEAGADDVRVVQSPGGQPALIARWPAPTGAPTVLLYGHADVQPTGPVADWTSDPFEPVEREGRLYGRGTADDKAGVAMHLAVLRAFAGRPPVGVTLLVEGEEESGSPTLAALLDEHQETLAADVIVIADSSNPAVDVPGLTTSLRGLVDCYVEVRMLERPVHSGMYGGPLGDALTALCRLLATLHDERGDVAVPGLVTADSDAPDVEPDTFLADAGALPGVELIGSGTVPERLWTRPALSVLGIDAPSVEGASNVLLDRARAMVSLRLAPGPDPAAAQEALSTHLEAHAPWGAQVTVTPHSAGSPFRLETSGLTYDLAREVFAAAYGNEVVEAGVGGSIPFIAEFARRFPDAAVLVTGAGDPASRWHGIDESLHLGLWRTACIAEALLLQRLAEQP